MTLFPSENSNCEYMLPSFVVFIFFVSFSASPLLSLFFFLFAFVLFSMVDLQDTRYQVVPMQSIPTRSIRQRGLLDSSTDNIRSTRSPFYFSSGSKRWRWWNYVSVAIVTLTFIELVLLTVSTTLLSLASSPVTFRKYIVYYSLKKKS